MVKTSARFIEPMLLLSTEKLPQGPDWLYEIKLDGYRSLGHQDWWPRAQLRPRNDNDFTTQYAPITAALRALPDETVIDGEVVALGDRGASILPPFAEFPNVKSTPGHSSFSMC